MMLRGFDDYPRPSLAVDPAVLTVYAGRLWVALWRRQYPPETGCWALPGVFVNLGEHLEEAVARALRTKINLSGVSYQEQLFTWNKMNRDPRGWVVTVAYFALAPHAQLQAAITKRRGVGLLALDVEDRPNGHRARIVDMHGRPIKLAFDHADILGRVLSRLRSRLWDSSVVCSLLPEHFTLHEMRIAYEAILGCSLNKDSFRRKVTKTQPIVQQTGRYQEDVNHRPAELFTRNDER